MEVVVRAMEDVAYARQELKRFAAGVGFRPEDLSRLEIVISELASNQVKHAGGGVIGATRLESDGRRGLRLTAVDHGPGIADLEHAMTSGCSTGNSFGDGLNTVRELMDTFEISAEPGHGTRVEAVKWAG